jgi:hypothetical protein
VQDKSAEKYSQANRLKRIRIVAQSNWDVLAKEMKLSESMIYAVLAGRKELSPKSLHRLEILEKAFQIEPPPETLEVHEDHGESRGIEHWKQRAERAEAELNNLRNGLRTLLEGPRPSVPRRASSKPASELTEHESFLDAAEDKGRDS